MTKKTVAVVAATGAVGSACVDELINHDQFDARVLVRKAGQQERASFRALSEKTDKQKQYDVWQSQGVEIVEADLTLTSDLITAFEGVDYVVSCVPFTATSSQYPLIHAAAEAGVERFVPSEFGFIYEWEQFWPTHSSHRALAREKVFIRRVIENSGLDFTIIPAGLFPEFFMLEPVSVAGDGSQVMSWSTGPDAGRIIPHVLAHPLSHNAVCPVAATLYCSWDELLAMREEVLGRKIERNYVDEDSWRAAYNQAAEAKDELAMTVTAISLAACECPEGMPLWANWNAKHLPDFKGMQGDELFNGFIEPFVEEVKKSLGL